MKPTQAQYAVLHAVLSAAVATMIGAATLATQYYFNNGQDLWLALAFFVAALPTTFGALRYAVWHALQTSAALPQAEADTASQVANEANQLARQALARIEQTWPAIRDLQLTLSSASVRTPSPFAPVTQLVPQGPLSSTSAATMVMPKAPQPILFAPSPNLTGTTTVPTLHFGDTGQVPIAPPRG